MRWATDCFKSSYITLSEPIVTGIRTFAESVMADYGGLGAASDLILNLVDKRSRAALRTRATSR